ncbi:hypothetical protein CR513_02356, partial [Mucuna pruriens]
MRVEFYLEALDLWEAVEEDYEVPPLPDNPAMEEYAGDKRIQSMQVLNLMKEFELQKMKEYETIKGYSDKLLCITNKIRLLGTNFVDSRIVEKIMVTVPERYKASITSLENAQEQRRIMSQDHTIEGALLVKSQETGTSKRKKLQEDPARKQ